MGSLHPHEVGPQQPLALPFLTEAAMAPPITYRDGIARWHKRTASDVVFGVLMSTRPDDDGQFRIPAFATIHANLSAAYEAEAARFAALQGEIA